ncbi:MAG: hypothetical protein AAGC47_06095, partial [Bacteroidota bacterium]
MKQIFLSSIAIAISIFVASCDDDDEDNNPPPSSSFPVTLNGMNEAPEFRMWTNGQEVNTSNLDPEDYVNSIFWPLLDPNVLLVSSYTFSMDSLISQSDTTLTFAYNFRGDSLFISGLNSDGTPFDNSYVGLGDVNELITSLGFFSYFESDSSLFPEFRIKTSFVDIDLVEEDTGQDDIINS